MNKILLFTDPHFCSYSSILQDRGETYSVRLENQLQTMNWIVEIAKENQCEEVFCLGDFFDKPELSAEEISALSEINFEDLNVHFIVGNHEMGRGDLEFSSAHMFLLKSGCEVYNSAAILGIGNTLIHLLPYQLEINRKQSIMDYFPKTIPYENFKYSILLTHNDIRGINLGHFITKDGFDKEDLDCNFDLVVNGHLHNQQWVTSKILNLGNITGQNFSEDGFKFPHQVMILDCDTLEYELIKNPYAIYFYKLDFTGENDNIDYINKLSARVQNGVVSIVTTEKSYKYIKYRFDPTDRSLDGIGCPQNCNILKSRISIQRKNSIAEEAIENLYVDHLNMFKDYVTENMDVTDILISELQEVVK